MTACHFTKAIYRTHSASCVHITSSTYFKLLNAISHRPSAEQCSVAACQCPCVVQFVHVLICGQSRWRKAWSGESVYVFTVCCVILDTECASPSLSLHSCILNEMCRFVCVFISGHESSLSASQRSVPGVSALPLCTATCQLLGLTCMMHSSRCVSFDRTHT